MCLLVRSGFYLAIPPWSAGKMAIHLEGSTISPKVLWRSIIPLDFKGNVLVLSLDLRLNTIHSWTSTGSSFNLIFFLIMSNQLFLPQTWTTLWKHLEDNQWKQDPPKLNFEFHCKCKCVTSIFYSNNFEYNKTVALSWWGIHGICLRENRYKKEKRLLI